MKAMNMLGRAAVAALLAALPGVLSGQAAPRARARGDDATAESPHDLPSQESEEHDVSNL